MLLSRDAIAAAVESCGAEDFYKPAHAHVFSAITGLYTRGEPADPVTVSDELRRSGVLEAVGDPSMLLSLQVNTPSTANASHYARIVEEHALLRRLVTVAGEIAELGYSIPEDVAEVVDRAESMVFEVAQRRIVDTMSPLRELLAESLDHLEHLYERGESITGVPTGYADLDERLAGLQKSNLLVVGARPAMGKTSFALGIVAHAAIKARVPTLLFSLEMSHLELTQRLLCSEARVDATRMRNGRLLESDWPKISDAIGRLGDAPIYIDDNPNLTVMDIRAKARRLKSREGLGLVVIDYLQLMTGRNRAENRQVEVSEISRGLKVLARELDLPVIALSQLSRGLEMRQDKRPVLADLRESGCLTADTRVVRADTGAEVTMGELLATGERDIPVWAVDNQLQIVEATMSYVFASGVKPVFELQLASGRRVRGSGNHPFRTPEGWRRLEELEVGMCVATPRVLPPPSVRVSWPDAKVIMLAQLVGDGCLVGHDALGAQGDPHTDQDTAADASVLRRVASLPRRQVGLFLWHLWATVGRLAWRLPSGQVTCYETAGSRVVAEDVQHLLLRFGIASRVIHHVGATSPSYEVCIDQAEDQRRFVEEIGVHVTTAGSQDALAVRSTDVLADIGTDVPGGGWERIVTYLGGSAGQGRDLLVAPARAETEIHGGDSAVFPGRSPASARVGEERAEQEIDGDVCWDAVVGIVSMGEEPVFDAAVPGPHNFLANGIVAHNSIEQDADVVMFIYRDEVYNPESPDRGTAEVILAKHRNGPTGVTQLAFVDHYTRFANMAKG
jgi:replicative DNA helicase